jgi:hypothetical protein
VIEELKVFGAKQDQMINVDAYNMPEAVMSDREEQGIDDRRKFLISAGRFAAVTPPAITLLLSSRGGSWRSPRARFYVKRNYGEVSIR